MSWNGSKINLKRLLLRNLNKLADPHSKEIRSYNMSKIRSAGNKSTELRLIKLFKELGITGWRRHPGLPGRPDFCFPRLKTVIFVDGCYWHLCPLCGHIPKNNKDYWEKKLLANKRRDKSVSKQLKTKGFKVVRIWEHRFLKRNMVTTQVI